MGAPPNRPKEECEEDLSPGMLAKGDETRLTGRAISPDFECGIEPREVLEPWYLP